MEEWQHTFDRDEVGVLLVEDDVDFAQVRLLARYPVVLATLDEYLAERVLT